MSPRVTPWVVLGIGAAVLICEAQQILALQRYRVEDAERSPSVLPVLATSAFERSGFREGDVHLIALVRSGNTVRSYRLNYQFDDPAAYGMSTWEREAATWTESSPVGAPPEFAASVERPQATPIIETGATRPRY